MAELSGGEPYPVTPPFASVAVVVPVPGPAGPIGTGVPSGGSPGQALVKASSDDYATEWLSIAGVGDTVAVTEGQLTEAIQTHVNDSTPHPAYDDLPSLAVLFENGLI